MGGTLSVNERNSLRLRTNQKKERNRQKSQLEEKKKKRNKNKFTKPIQALKNTEKLNNH